MRRIEDLAAFNQILEICLVRDDVQRHIESSNLNAEQLKTISHLDERLRAQIKRPTRRADRQRLNTALAQLGKIRNILAPSPDAWWWYQTGFVWNSLALTSLAVSFSLLTDIVTRFLAVSPGFVGGFVVIGQISLALLGGALLLKRADDLSNRRLPH